MDSLFVKGCVRGMAMAVRGCQRREWIVFRVMKQASTALEKPEKGAIRYILIGTSTLLGC